jgi:UDP-glucose 4-epimerase
VYDRVLVTGGAGFIGSHTVDALLDDGVEVWVLDDLSNGSMRNLHKWKGDRRLHFRKNSITRRSVVEALTKRVEAVVHLAAAVSPYLSAKKAEFINEVNVSGTLNILSAARRSKVQRFVFASSASVYGEQSVLPISEDNPLQPMTPYGASKVSGEMYCKAYFQTYGLSTISLRYFNAYGERQAANPYSGVIRIFADQLSRGLRPKIYGDGEQTRDFIHVSDVVAANVQALRKSEGAGQAFNIGTGRATSINQLFSIIVEAIGRPELSPIHVPERVGDIRHSCASTKKAMEILGVQPKVGLRQGLRDLLSSRSRR